MFALLKLLNLTVFGYVDGRYGWLVRGSSLEVVNLSSANRVAAWCFGAVLKDHRMTVTCVAEYFYSNSLKLLVGLKTPAEKGMLCVFDVKRSKVIKAIDVPYKVSEVIFIYHMYRIFELYQDKTLVYFY